MFLIRTSQTKGFCTTISLIIHKHPPASLEKNLYLLTNGRNYPLTRYHPFRGHPIPSPDLHLKLKLHSTQTLLGIVKNMRHL